MPARLGEALLGARDLHDHPAGALADVGAADVGDDVEPLRERVDDRLFDQLLGERQLELLTRQRGASCRGAPILARMPRRSLLARLGGAKRSFDRDIEVARERDPAATLARRDPALLPRPPRASGCTAAPTPSTRAAYRLPARVVSQVSRFVTGIEIHPGAQIGPGLLHRPRHGRGHRRDHRDRRGRHDLPGRHPRRHGQGRRASATRPCATGSSWAPARACSARWCSGECSKVGAGAIVIKDVPPNSTVVGNPGPPGRGRRPARARATCTTRTSTTCTCPTPSPRR